MSEYGYNSPEVDAYLSQPGPEPRGVAEKLCEHCGANWTWFVWEDDDEPPCYCDVSP